MMTIIAICPDVPHPCLSFPFLSCPFSSSSHFCSLVLSYCYRAAFTRVWSHFSSVDCLSEVFMSFHLHERRSWRQATADQLPLITTTKSSTTATTFILLLLIITIIFIIIILSNVQQWRDNYSVDFGVGPMTLWLVVLYLPTLSFLPYSSLLLSTLFLSAFHFIFAAECGSSTWRNVTSN